LTQDNALESDPAWSPSLTQVAFIAAANPAANRSDLYVANADGSEPRRLTDDSAVVRSPCFVGPSGDQIVFESNRGGRSQLYVINRDGTGRRQLNPGGDANTSPEVSPDGRRVLFVSPRETAPRERHYNVYQVNLDGTGEGRLTTGPRIEDSPAFAPDGRSFFYLRDEGGTPATKRVYRQDLFTGVASAITPPGMFVRDFSVSADASTLVLTIIQSDARGLQTSQLALYAMATGQLTPFMIPGVERVAGPVFRPATLQPR
jgi:Tol biopolymer transport system component